MTQYHWLSIRQVANRLGVSKRTIYRYIKDGKLKASKPAGYVWRVREDEFARFVNHP